jgi:hypothetical protein
MLRNKSRGVRRSIDGLALDEKALACGNAGRILLKMRRWWR